MTTVRAALSGLIRNPGELLIRQWNWKSALYSSLIRASLFFAVNARAGLRAAVGAMAAEFVYRALSAGFYGSITQSLRQIEPKWKGTLASLSILLTLSHSIEFIIHWLRGTPNLAASIMVSIAFTALSTLFNLYAMRRGVFVTGRDSQSLAADLVALPSIVLGFLLQLPRAFAVRAFRPEA